MFIINLLYALNNFFFFVNRASRLSRVRDDVGFQLSIQFSAANRGVDARWVGSMGRF